MVRSGHHLPPPDPPTSPVQAPGGAEGKAGGGGCGGRRSASTAPPVSAGGLIKSTRLACKSQETTTWSVEERQARFQGGPENFPEPGADALGTAS
jgi:hypothetical protein